MTAEQQTFSHENMDFDALYAGQAAFDGVGPAEELVPWDIGGPQQAVVDLVQSGGFAGTVLDVGCGLGEHAILLAAQDFDVVGVDGSPTAIGRARRRAAAQDIQVRFEVADATELHGVGQGFHTVLDSGLYHCLNDDQRSAYAAALHRVCAPAAVLHLFCFAESVSSGIPIVQEALISKANLHSHLDEHWQILDVVDALFATSFTRELLARIGGVDTSNGTAARPGVDAVRTDELGRVLTPMSHVRALRR